MTMFLQSEVINNLRKERKRLAGELLIAEGTLEAVKAWHNAQLGRQVDPTDIRELGEILEAEGP